MVPPSKGCVRAVTVVLVAAMLGGAGGSQEPAARYEHARSLYYRLRASPDRQQLRHHWIEVIAAFVKVQSRFPKSPQAGRAAYTAADLWRGLHRISRVPEDQEKALLAYLSVGEYMEIDGAPVSLHDDALLQAAKIYLSQGKESGAARTLDRLLELYPKGDMVAQARAMRANLGDAPPPQQALPGEVAGAIERRVSGRAGKGIANVKEVRAWVNPHYSRVAIYVDAPVSASSGRIPASGGSPERLYVDIRRARLPAKLELPELGDPRVVRLRSGARDDDVVRWVLELAAPARHQVMVMEQPHRVVVDILADTGPEEGDPIVAAIARAAALSKRHVVLDAGHGGKDRGAKGPTGLTEKAVVLAITKRCAKALRNHGIEVTLTRDRDVYVSLEDRSAIANRSGAHLFVSIHANAHTKESARGIETYYLDVASNRYARRLAAVENKTSEAQISELELILADLTTKAATTESVSLARRVQRGMVKGAKGHHRRVRDLGVKGSLFYVLLGTRIPSVLAETSFISNRTEGKLLGTAAYQESLAKGIANAIQEHFEAAKPALSLAP